MTSGVNGGRTLLSAVLKGAATSYRGRLADVSGVSACGCVASVLARNDRRRRASSPHLPPTSGQVLCSTAGVYKFIMPSSGIQNRVRVCGFFSRICSKPSAYEILRTVTTLQTNPAVEKKNDKWSENQWSVR